MKATAETRKLIDVREVAALCGVTSRTVWSWAREGAIPPPMRIRGVTRWDAAVIHDWIDAGCPAVATEA